MTFTHPEIPIKVDISIVKNSTTKDKRVIPVYTTSESGVFENAEVYEIELEVNNSMIGPGTLYNQSDNLLVALRKTIKYVMMGLQGTNYPISYPEQAVVLQEYMKLVHTENGTYNPDKRIYPSDFIGPSSYTLQLQNIVPLNDNNNVPNIRKDYSVTEKADGERTFDVYFKERKNLFIEYEYESIILLARKPKILNCLILLLTVKLFYTTNTVNLLICMQRLIYILKKVLMLENTVLLLKM